MMTEGKTLMTKEQIKARIYSFYTTDYFKTHKVSCYTIIEHKRILEEAIESDEYNQEEKNYCKNKLKCYQIELKRQIEILQKELEEEEKKNEKIIRHTRKKSNIDDKNNQ